MILTKRNRSFAAEWDCQDGILISWPHAGTDWAYMLDEVTACYVEMVHAILDDDERLIIVAPDGDEVREALGEDVDWQRIDIVEMATNDTWVRDYGPITVFKDGQMVRLIVTTWLPHGLTNVGPSSCHCSITATWCSRGDLSRPTATVQ